MLSAVHVIVKLSHRDKPVQDKLIARAIEICEQQGIPNFQYGSWSRGGLGSFKVKHGFRRVEFWRYFVPLTPAGKVVLKLGLHRNLRDRLPESWVEAVRKGRVRYVHFRYRGILGTVG